MKNSQRKVEKNQKTKHHKKVLGHYNNIKEQACFFVLIPIQRLNSVQFGCRMPRGHPLRRENYQITVGEIPPWCPANTN